MSWLRLGYSSQEEYEEAKREQQAKYVKRMSGLITTDPEDVDKIANLIPDKDLYPDFRIGKSGPDSNIVNYDKTEDKRTCLLYTSPSPRDRQKSRMPSSA